MFGCSFKKKILWSACLLMFAQASVANNDLIERAAKALNPNIQIQSIDDTPFEHLKAVRLMSKETIYFEREGRFFIQGDLYQVNGSSAFNLTQRVESDARLSKMVGIGKMKSVDYIAEEETGVVYIFTDVDCTYCVSIHQDVKALNDAGVTVKYLPFVRSGKNSPTYAKMNAIWCETEDTSRRMMDTAKNRDSRNVALSLMDCGVDISEYTQFGVNLGIGGTPSILFEDGQLIPGKVPIQGILAHIPRQ